MMGLGEWSIEKRSSFRSESFSKDIDNVPKTGCLSVIVLSASGDLAKKKTFPALFKLYRQGFLPSEEVHVFGYARTKISDEKLKNRIHGFLVDNEAASSKHSDCVLTFLQLIKYVSGSYDTEEGFQKLDKKVSEHGNLKK